MAEQSDFDQEQSNDDHVRELKINSMLKSRPDAQINAVLELKTQVLNDQQAAYLENILLQRQKRASQPAYVPKIQCSEEEVQDESCTVGIEEERQESATRLQQLSGVVSGQHKVYRRIENMVKVAELDEEQVPHSSPATDCLSPCNDPASPSCSSWATREVNALILAKQFETLQARNERIQDGQRGLLQKKLKKHEDLHARLEAEESRQAKRTEDRHLEQKEKMYHTQQKHIDQQRMLRELQRRQEKQQKLLQAKCNTTAKKLARPASSPAKLRGSSMYPGSEKEGVDEPIYQEMRQSHAKFNGTLVKFQQYVADNERRKEAQRLRSKEHEGKGRCRTPSKETTKAFVTQLSPTSTISRADTLSQASPISTMSRADTCRTPSKETTAFLTQASPNSMMSRADTAEVTLCADSTAWMSKSFTDASADRALSPARYESRLARCKTHELELEAQRYAKRAHDEMKLAAHQERGRNEVEKKAEVAGSMVQVWESKSNEAASRRQNQKIADGKDFARKHEMQENMHADFKQEKQQDSENRAALAAQSQENVLDASRRLMERKEHDRRSRQQEKTSKATAKNDRKLHEFDNRVTSSKHAKELEAVLARRDMFDKEFRRQAASEIKAKLTRSTSALRWVKKASSDPAMESVQARPRTAPRSAPVSTLASMTIDNCVVSTEKSIIPDENSGLRALDNTVVVEAYRAQAVPAGGNASPEMLGGHRRPQSGIGARRNFASSEIYQGSRQARRASLSSASMPVPVTVAAKAWTPGGDGESSSDDEDLLQDIETRSCRWLREARRAAMSR